MGAALVREAVVGMVVVMVLVLVFRNVDKIRDGVGGEKEEL